MLTYRDLAQAASQNDALAEQDGTDDTITAAGAKASDVVAVAKQRALRAVLAYGGRPIPTDRVTVTLSEDEELLLSVLLPGIIDGITIGLRAAQNQQNKETPDGNV